MYVYKTMYLAIYLYRDAQSFFLPSLSLWGLMKVHKEVKPRRLGRRLIYFHHIINPNKRDTVIGTAVDLQLGGYSKYGRFLRM